MVMEAALAHVQPIVYCACRVSSLLVVGEPLNFLRCAVVIRRWEIVASSAA